MRKIALFRALYLGDTLCAIPAVRALRKAFPYASITWIGLPQMRSLLDRYPAYVDRFIPFPPYPKLVPGDFDPLAFQSFAEAIKDQHFDLLLQMQGNGSIINPLLAHFGSRRVGGFCQTELEENANFLLYPNHMHEIHRHIRLMNHLGVPSDGDHIDFPLQEKDYAEYASAKLPLRSGTYICIHPGSKERWRQWPVKYFARVADFLSDKGFDIVITGTESERLLAQQVAGYMKRKPIIAAGKLSIGGTAVLLSRAVFYVTNCTGVSHLAAALKIPSLVISMDGEPKRWGPLNKELHRTIDWSRYPDFNAVLKEIESIFFTESPISLGDG